MNQKVCPECRGPVRGRADKKYCCEACRNAFNNKKKGRSSELIKKINAIIKKNHFILKEKNPGEKPQLSEKYWKKRDLTSIISPVIPNPQMGKKFITVMTSYIRPGITSIFHCSGKNDPPSPDHRRAYTRFEK